MKIPGALLLLIFAIGASTASATTKGLSQIVTPEPQTPGDLSLSFQWQSLHIGDPYELQPELGLCDFPGSGCLQRLPAQRAYLRNRNGILRKEPFLLSTGFVNWSPHSHVDPQPFLEAGYYTEHHKLITGAIHNGYRNQAILGYALDFNQTWRAQIDSQSGEGNSSTIGFTWNITRDFQVNPAIYFPNYHPERILGYVVFTNTFHLWGTKTRP